MTMNHLRAAAWIGGALASLTLAACNKPASNGAAAANTALASGGPATQAPVSGDAGDVKAFLDGLYAHYNVDPKASTWAPMDKNDAEVFDADMVRLLAEDVRINKGEVGVVDGDYLCSFQDWEPFTTTVTVASATPTAAKASADFRVFKTDPPRHLEFDLVKENGAWRIHDVRVNDATQQPPGDSLRVSLEKEIKNPPKPGESAD
jgi:hypothetical protein